MLPPAGRTWHYTFIPVCVSFCYLGLHRVVIKDVPLAFLQLYSSELCTILNGFEEMCSLNCEWFDIGLHCEKRFMCCTRSIEYLTESLCVTNVVSCQLCLWE